MIEDVTEQEDKETQNLQWHPKEKNSLSLVATHYTQERVEVSAHRK